MSERRAIDGLFHMDQSRLRYLTHLRSEQRRSPRTAADAAHVEAKTQMPIKLAEKRRELVRQSDVDELVDTFCWPRAHQARRLACACCKHRLGGASAGRSRPFELRTEISHACEAIATELGEETAQRTGLTG